VNLIAVTILTDVRFTSMLAKYFYAVRISILLAILSEIFIQIGNFSNSHGRKQKWLFFVHSVL